MDNFQTIPAEEIQAEQNFSKMKRSLQQVNNLPTDGAPPIKRASSENSKLAEESEGQTENSFYLVHQNRELSKELKRKQLKIQEYEEQSEFYHGQISKIEQFLEFIDRVWHQFESDISTLLETLGYPQLHIEEQQHDEEQQQQQEENYLAWSSLLQQYLEANLTYFESIPCAIGGELDIDEWSNEPEIEEARIQALENCLDPTSGLDIVKEELVNRLEFTKKSVEKLYDIVNQQTEGQLAAVLTPLTEDRNIRTELDLLRDQVTKYKHEVITVTAEMAHLKRKLKKTEKQLIDAPLASLSAATARSESGSGLLVRSSSVQSLGSLPEKKGGDTNPENAESMDVIDEIVKETPLCQQNGEILDSRLVIGEAVSKLQQQLEEAQQRMVSAEKSLTDYMATTPATPQPVNNSAEIARLQKLLTEVRTVSNKKLGEIRAEKSALMIKISDLERGMGELVAKTEKTIDEMAIACAEELAKEKLEKEKIQIALKAAEAEVKLMANMQSQVNEMQTIHDTSKSRLEKLTERVRAQADTITILEGHLSASKQREKALESSLKERVSENEVKSAEENQVPQEDSTSKKETMDEEEEEGVIHEPTASDKEHPNYQMLSQLLINSQTRCKELETELADAKANMDELIVEIESVATEEEKTRTQNSRLLKQINEGHTVHKAVLQENLRLHQDINTLQEKELVASAKVDNITNQMKIIESTMLQLRQAEQVARGELSSSAITLSDLRVANETQQKRIEELEAKLQQTVEESQKYQERLQELKERCNLLTANADEERNKRLELERLRDEDKREKEKESNRISVLMAKAAENESKSDQSTMLEMTLNMLRCSVCKDRFKQVAITKCFHLFCRECINENLKNRNRKCPACGEKFGQEDVKSVFFAH